MRDLQTWKLLLRAREGTPLPEPTEVERDGASLLEALEELAELNVGGRRPFLGLVVPHIEHGDLRVRAAAIRCLRRVAGVEGLRAIVRALEDPSPEVSGAAVDALRGAAEEAPLRWAHALFAPGADVRRRALELDPPQGAAHLGAYLRADPELGELARRCPWPKPALPLLFDFHRRGVVSREEASSVLIDTSAEELRGFLAEGPARSAAACRDFLRAARASATLPGAPGFDLIDAWRDIVERAPSGRGRAYDTLVEAVLGAHGRRLATRVAVALCRGGVPSVEAAHACAVARPESLAYPGTPLDRRRAATAAILRHAERIEAPPLNVIDGLLDCDLVVGEGAELHLGAAAAVARLYPSERVGRLMARFGLDRVVAAAGRDEQGWIRLAALPREQDGAYEHLLRAVLAAHPERTARSLALELVGRCESGAAEVAPLLTDCSAGERRSIALALIELEATGTTAIKPRARARLVEGLVPELPIGAFGDVLERAGSDPAVPVIARELVAAGLGHVDEETLVAILEPRSDEALGALVAWLDEGLALSIARIEVLARELVERELEPLRAWGRAVLEPAVRVVRVATHRDPQTLAPEAVERIASCPDAELEAALGPAFRGPSLGLAAALARREPPARGHAGACLALIACADPMPEVATELDRFWNEEPEFRQQVGVGAVGLWARHEGLPPIGRAFLWRWEQQGLAVLEWMDGQGTLLDALRLADALPGRVARPVLWQAIAAGLQLRRYRAPEALVPILPADPVPLVGHLVEELDSEVGAAAARILAVLWRAELCVEAIAAARDEMLARGPDLDADTRHELHPVVRIDEVPAPAVAPRRRWRLVREDSLWTIRRSTDVDHLEQLCERAELPLVREAAHRLVELGAPGELRVLALLGREPPVPCAGALVDSVRLWSDPAALGELRRLVTDGGGQLGPGRRFKLALALAARDEPGFLDLAVQVALEPLDHVAGSWFERPDYELLEKRHDDAVALAMALAGSDHPHAYRPAVKLLLGRPAGDHAAMEGLRTFLEQGTRRPHDLRLDAARRLWDEGDRAGAPILLDHLMRGPDDDLGARLLSGADRRLASTIVDLCVETSVWGGKPFLPESRLIALLRGRRGPMDVRQRGLRRLLEQGKDPKVRETLVTAIGASMDRDTKLVAISGIFAWGVRRGRDLTGRLFGVHMTHRRADFGYTHLDQSKIYVSPLPLLRGDRHGADIVEALVLHELGHHVYHRGAKAAEVWKRAQRQGFFPVLNLVADEHLERNLRAMDAEYGDRLKRLAAYAFQHQRREWPVESLLGLLGGAAFDVLTRTPMTVAFDDASVVVESGALLRELDRLGNAYARFVRALRMGLGNRQADPKVEEALELFRGGFRHSSMEQLYAITERVVEIFGRETSIASGFGGHEGLEWDEREGSIHGDGIMDEDVQREVERILDPRKLEGGSDRPGRPGRLAINVAEDDRFDVINKVEPVPPDPGRHREVAREIRRHADRLREYMARLGLDMVPRRARLRGRSFDRTRASAVVLRRDPRMLVARELEISTDLFIGVVIDCSGSMGAYQSMEKAHRFGVLLAEAVRPLRGVDARFFGFTDRIIFDAGDARQCAVTSLQPTGGNNDAAGLYHAASVAAQSTRRARLLVMISDGLPTECSVSSLRALVRDLSRNKGMVCAQVAVRPLEEVCFPHYVEIQADQLDLATRRFGEIITGLVQRALGR